MTINMNILYGLYAIYVRTPWRILRGAFFIVSGFVPATLSFFAWCGPRLMIGLMLFIKYVLPWLAIGVAWFFLWEHLAWWFFLGTKDRQKYPNDRYFLASLATILFPALLLLLHNFGSLYRRTPW